MELYFRAAEVIDKLDRRQGSIKALTLRGVKGGDVRLYALVLETLKYRETIDAVMSASRLFEAERKLGKHRLVTLVLVHDLLFARGAGRKSCGGIRAGVHPLRDAVVRHRARLTAELTKVLVRSGARDVKELAKKEDAFVARWGRVNTIIVTFDDAIATLESSGYHIVETLKEVRDDPHAMLIDPHIPNLLAFHPTAKLTEHRLYLDGGLILQNKASCMPAAVLSPGGGAQVVDGCAAPGNKTSHAAALVGAGGKVVAFERDGRRAEILRSMLARAGTGSLTQVIHADFTTSSPLTDPHLAPTTHILLDPSCSGSGIVNRLDYLTSSGEDDSGSDLAKEDGGEAGEQDRLAALATFQRGILQHAMKVYPNAYRIAYSTCSVHAIEDEAVVVKAVLSQEPATGEWGRWHVAERKDALPGWPLRGRADACMASGVEDPELARRMAEGMIRCVPGSLDNSEEGENGIGKDQGTIGFFVALLVREKVSSKRSHDHDEDDDNDDDTNDERVHHDDKQRETTSMSAADRRRLKKNKRKKARSDKSSLNA
ncbi:hypothetical protein PYCC9005_004765 [Savitreella phatthalungensis]